MDNLSNLYSELLKVYTEQVEKLEKIKAEASEKHHIGWIPHMALNTRMFTYDEYLQNIHHGGFCFEEKNKIMPHLVRFIATYECSSEEAIKNFEQEKEQNNYQKQLDSIVFDKIPIIDFSKSQLRGLRDVKDTYDIPYPPKRRNATRQMAKYKTDRKKYFEKIDILNRCREEVEARIELIEKIQQEVKE